MGSYRHPVFAREESFVKGSGIYDTQKRDFSLLQAGTRGYARFDESLDEFLARLHDSERLRKALKIPNMIYHAYGFPSRGYDVQHVRNIVEWARQRDLEVRTWVNEESALVLVCVADPDTSEDSGMGLYEYVRQNAKSYESYGLASWFEYCKFGVPLPDDWQLLERSGRLMAASPDGRYYSFIGD